MQYSINDANTGLIIAIKKYIIQIVTAVDGARISFTYHTQTHTNAANKFHIKFYFY